MTGQSTYEHVHNALDTVTVNCITMETTTKRQGVMKEWMKDGKDRCAEIRQEREKEREEGGGREAERVLAQRVEMQR